MLNGNHAPGTEVQVLKSPSTEFQNLILLPKHWLLNFSFRAYPVA
jgi:hypothetical protein